MRIDYEHAHEVRTQEQFMASQDALYRIGKRRISLIANAVRLGGLCFLCAGAASMGSSKLGDSLPNDLVHVALGFTALYAAQRYQEEERWKLDNSYRNLIVRLNRTKLGF